MRILGSQLSITSTPLIEGPAVALGTLDNDQESVVIGDPIHIVFGKRVGEFGGVLVSPPATEARFESFTQTEEEQEIEYIRAYYQLVLSDGEIGRIQIRDVFQQSCRVGSFFTAYDARAADWVAGNFLDSSIDSPQFCGTGGSYKGLTMLSFQNAIPIDFDQWKRQVHVFVRNGVKVDRLIEEDIDSSNNYVDLVYYLYKRTARLDLDLVDLPSLRAAARFVAANGFTCNTLIKASSNLVEWLQRTSPLFLLRRARIKGKEGLKPLLPFNADGTIDTGFIPWVYTFTNDDILRDGFEVSYTPLSARKPFAVLAIWRQQPDDDIGLVRTTNVRYAGTAEEGPFEQQDFTDFVTSENHAVKIAAYILARRRYIEHTLRLIVSPNAFVGSASVGDIVRVKSDNTDQDGNTLTHDYLYEIDSINKTLTGNVELQLTHFPVDSQGRSLVAIDVANAQGANFLLPTGRQAVSCDFNDPDDTDFIPEFPFPEFPFPFDPPLDVPIGDGPWEYDPGLPEGPGWTNPDYSPSTNPDELFPDGVTDSAPNGDFLEDELGEAPKITLGSLTVGYIQARYYDVGASNYAIVSGKLTVDRPPLIDLTISLFSESGSLNVTIPKPEEDEEGVPDPGPYEVDFKLGASLSQPFFCRTNNLLIARANGGGYPEYEFSAGQSFEVCPYVSTLTLEVGEITATQATFSVSLDKPCITDPAVIVLAVGDGNWEYDFQSESFRWTTDQYPPQAGPQIVQVEIPAYEAFIGDFVFNAITQTWDYLGIGTPGASPAVPTALAPIQAIVGYEEVEEAFVSNLRVWALEARNGGFSSINVDSAKEKPEPVSLSPYVLIHFDGTAGSQTFIDSSENNFTVANADDWDPSLGGGTSEVILSATSKFGSASAVFAGGNSNDMLEIDAKWFVEAGGEFTVDFWAKAVTLGFFEVMFVFRTVDEIGATLGLSLGLFLGELNFYNLSFSEDYVLGPAVGTNWNHYAVERYQGTFYIYFNGQLQGTYQNDDALNPPDFPFGQRNMYLGARERNPLPPANEFGGFIDEFRVVNSALYKGNNFTPPAAPYEDP
jgi:hypothetical protein